MSAFALAKTRIRGGVWEGVLTASAAVENPPKLSVHHLEQEIAKASVEALPDQECTWSVRVEIPADLLNDGVQTFLIRQPGSEETLSRFSIITGESAEDDMRAELDLLRAELDMLKRAFRRHCVDTM